MKFTSCDCEYQRRWQMPIKSTLVQVMAYYLMASSHYLNQCCPSLMTSYHMMSLGGQWWNPLCAECIRGNIKMYLNFQIFIHPQTCIWIFRYLFTLKHVAACWLRFSFKENNNIPFYKVSIMADDGLVLKGAKASVAMTLNQVLPQIYPAPYCRVNFMSAVPALPALCA